MLAIIVTLAVTVVPQYVDGNQRIVQVSELTSDDGGFITNSENNNSHNYMLYVWKLYL